jgi:uncharacterized membrane protein
MRSGTICKGCARIQHPRNAMLPNPLAMNDWSLRATLKVVFASLLAVWVLIGLDALGAHLVLLRGIFGAILLLFIPGLLILRALRVHHLGAPRTLVFAVGLSIATVMFVGLFANVVYPVAGVSRPMTTFSLMGTLTAVIVALAAVSYWRDRDLVPDAKINLNQTLARPVLFLCLMPFFMIFAVYAANAYHTNIALLTVLVIIGATVFWVATSARFPKEGYPLAAFVIAVAMLFFGSLVSSYPWGWDIQKELYHANLVLANGVWNASVSGATNSVISVTLLAPALTLITGVSVTWLFKIIYPLIFALVPLGLFIAFQSQTNDRTAFLAAFFVSSLFTYFGEMPALARQEIAEVFFVLLLILIVDKYQSAPEKKRAYALYAIFAISLVVSHYALAVIFLAYAVIAWLLLFLVENPALRRLQRSDQSKLNGDSRAVRMITAAFVLSFAVFIAVWYLSFGSAAAGAISYTVDQMFTIVFQSRAVALAIWVASGLYVSAFVLIYLFSTRRKRQKKSKSGFHSAALLVLIAALFVPEIVRSGVSLNSLLQIGALSPIHLVGFFLYLLSVFLIAAGLAVLTLRRCRRKFDVEFVALALSGFALLIAATVVPQLAFTVNTTRLFHISTLVLAPFCVTGALFVIWAVESTFFRSRQTHAAARFRVVAALFIVLFLFSTGFVYEVTGQQSTSFILNSKVDAPRFNEREVTAAEWLHAVRGETQDGILLPIYADAHRRVLFDGLDLDHPASEFPSWPPRTPPNAYIYLGTFNVESGQVAQVRTTTVLQGTVISYADLGKTTDSRGKIFDDGGAAVYYGGS